MHVVVVTNHRLPVKGYGGVQRVVAALVRGLAALGHRVTLLAQPGTKVPEAARTIEITPKVLRDGGAALARSLPDDVDIVHAHCPIAPPDGVPLLHTLHGNWKTGTPLPHNTVFLSRDHARRHGRLTFVYNGLDPADYVFRRRKEQWDLFLGQLHSNRGYHWAIEAAKRSGRRLIVAGGWRPSFAGAIKYVGEVDNKRKAVLLARARGAVPHRRPVHRRRLREPACPIIEDDLRGRVEYGPVGAGPRLHAQCASCHADGS